MSGTRLTFLGTGTSQGVPIIGCRCPVCQSRDPRDKRFRSSVYVEYGGMRILVDAGPDFRSQMLRAGLSDLDAILLTHNHKDHTGGLDDVRSLNYICRKAVEIYCEERVLETLREEYAYAFTLPKYPGAPEWHVNLIDEQPFILYQNHPDGELTWVHDKGYFFRRSDGTLSPTSDRIVETADHQADPTRKSVVITPIRGWHGPMPVLGFRFGKIAYITDMNRIDEAELAKLEGLEHLTLNTVGYHPHHSHFSLHEAAALAERIGAKHTWLTHLSHAFPQYDAFCEQLKKDYPCKRTDLRPAYDGLTLTAD